MWKDIVFFILQIVLEVVSIRLVIKGKRQKDYTKQIIGTMASLFAGGFIVSMIVFYLIKWL